MEKYASKEVVLNQPVERLYGLMSDINNLTPVIGDKVDGWQATAETCSFRVQGFPLSLRIGEKIENQLIKVVPDKDGGPIPFEFNLHFASEAGERTRFSLTLNVELNMMMRMMVGGKIKDGLDKAVETLAEKLNGDMA